jgi:hypothetical protein
MYVLDGNRSALQRRTNSRRLAAMPRFMARANPASNPISITVMRERVSAPNVDSSQVGTSWSGSLFKTMISISGSGRLRNVGRDFARRCMSRYVGMRTLIDGGTLRPCQIGLEIRLLNLPVSRVRLRLARRRGSVSRATQGRDRVDERR